MKTNTNSSVESQLIDADERLATVFSHFYCVRLPSQAPALPQQLLPNYEMVLAFNFGPAIPIQLGDAAHVVQQTAVLGPLRKILRYELPPGADLMVVNFTLDGFYRLLGKPMRHINAADWRTADVLADHPYFRDLWQQLWTMTGQADRLRHIRDHVLANLSPSEDAARSLQDSIPHFRSATLDPVKAVAQAHHISPRLVQTRFRTYVGYSAKEMIRFLRFKDVLHSLCQQNPARVDWQALVLEFAYHDQSHLIKDFQYFVGCTPRRFLRQLAEGGVCISKTGRFY